MLLKFVDVFLAKRDCIAERLFILMLCTESLFSPFSLITTIASASIYFMRFIVMAYVPFFFETVKALD
jgi:hypothetical protein